MSRDTFQSFINFELWSLSVCNQAAIDDNATSVNHRDKRCLVSTQLAMYALIGKVQLVKNFTKLGGRLSADYVDFINTVERAIYRRVIMSF